MAESNYLKNGNGGYVFISHSHNDIEQVRKIRNYMEEQGFEPLCFYLKCLNDDSEIEDLIKREIRAREWFVYVDSENARNSKWVQKEREYIASLEGKKILAVKLDDENDLSKKIDNEISIKRVSERIMNSMRVFISCSSRDQELADKIRSVMLAKDLRVFDWHDIPEESDYIDWIPDALKKTAEEGCLLSIVSQNGMKSVWCYRELMHVMANGGMILPVIVGKDVELTVKYKFLLEGVKCVTIDQEPSKEQLEMIVNEAEKLLLEKFYS